MRLDLPGTGDSVESGETPDLLPRWLDAITAAGEWLRRNCELDEVVPCGFRLGALLVTHAAPRLRSVDRTVLLAPVVSGRAFVRAQRVMAGMSDLVPPEAASDRDWLEAPGLRMHGLAARNLSALSLRGLNRAPARRILLVEAASGLESATPSVNRLAAEFTHNGAEVTVAAFTGYGAMMRDAHLNQPPAEVWEKVTTWLSEGSKLSNLPRAVPGVVQPVEGPGWTERTFLIASHHHVPLAATYTGSTGERSSAGPALVWLNTGANPRHGYGRSTVNLARLLARKGISSLRFDLDGVGDSGGRHCAVGLEALYSASRTANVKVALDWMEEQGHRRLVLAGVCSGAFQAMQAALIDSRVTALILANQLVYGRFRTRGTERLRVLLSTREPTMGVDEEAVLQTRVRYAPRLLTRIRTRFRQAGALADRLIWLPGGLGQIRRQLRQLSARGVETLVLTCRGDSSLDLLESCFGPDASHLARLAYVRVSVLPSLDHSLGSSKAQRLVAEQVSSFLDDLRNDIITRH